MSLMDILKPEIHILELDGFLNALRCVIGHSSKVFCAGLLQKNENDIFSIVEENVANIKMSGKLINRAVVNFNYIQQVFDEHIYSKLPCNNEAYTKNVDWNLIEYYGLISIAENENGPWNRLISQDSHILEYIDENDNKSVIYFVEHEEFIVITCL